ncbi:iron permease, partial [Paenibacillus darwinianus]
MLKRLLGMIGALTILFASPLSVFADARADMSTADAFVRQAIQKAQQNDIQGAKAAFEQYKSQWLNKEDGVKEASRQAYKDIENAMGMIQYSLAQDPVQPEKVTQAFRDLSLVLQKFITGGYPIESAAPASGNKPTLSAFIDSIRAAKQMLTQNDTAGAKSAIDQIQSSWLDVEAVVVAQSSQVYAAMEQDMVTAKALLIQNPQDSSAALQVLDRMITNLTPLAKKTSYTFLDAAMILLREGLEALLVVAALLTFLQRSGNKEKQKWIWSGVGAGLGLSMLLAIIVQLLFSSGTFGNNNALIGGWTALFAAAMLLYVSHWLHSNSSIDRWQKYIKNKTTQALAKGSLISLAFLSFLAVFREGTETVLFYIGMAPSIGLTGLLLGFGIGSAILLVIGGLIIFVG